MPKAQIVVVVDDASDVAAVDAWFDRWSPRLSHRSDNQGCGCCVNIWDVDAPAEALAELPAHCRTAVE